jgi:alpha-L-fucosidase
MDKHGPTIYETERCQVTRSEFARFTRKGNTLYVHVHFWPGEEVVIGGLKTKVTSARLFTTGQNVDFKQQNYRLELTGLPEKARTTSQQ